MVFHRLILNSIKKSLTSGRALITYLHAKKLASIVGLSEKWNSLLNVRSESPRKCRKVLGNS